MEELLNYLLSIQPLSEELTLYLQTMVKEKRVVRNEMLLRAGQVSRHIYYIKKGLLRSFYMKDDEEVSSWFMKEGDFVVSVSSFYSQLPADESIQALEDSLILYLPQEDLQRAYNRFAEFNFIGRVITERYYALSENRIRLTRMLKARERHDQLFETHRDLINRVPAKYLASYLGVTEVTFSRSRFKK